MGKMNNSGKITDAQLLSLFQSQEPVLGQLEVADFVLLPKLRGEIADAQVDLRWRAAGMTSEIFSFVAEVKTRSTPEAIHAAASRAREAAGVGRNPLIVVPYLSDKRLEELEEMHISGIDACGNGVVIVPGKLLVSRRGYKNLCPDSRSLNNPFSGRSAMVGRMLLEQGSWPSLNALHQALGQSGAIDENGKPLSLSQVSKAVSALVEERIVRKSGGSIVLREPLILLEELAAAWKMPADPPTFFCNVKEGTTIADLLSPSSLSTAAAGYQRLLHWSMTGESSALIYSVLPHHGPTKIAVSSLVMALNAMGSGISKAATPGFADLQLIETKEHGFYFMNMVDIEGKRWASLLQTWLELQAGDARQRESAADLKEHLLDQLRHEHDIP